MNDERRAPVAEPLETNPSTHALGVDLGTETDYGKAEALLSNINYLNPLQIAACLTNAFDNASSASALPDLSGKALATYGEKLAVDFEHLSPTDRVNRLAGSSRYDSPFFSIMKSLDRTEWPIHSREKLADGVDRLLTACPEIEGHIYPLVGAMLATETDWFIFTNHLLPLISKMSPRSAAESLTFALYRKDCDHQTMSTQVFTAMEALGGSLKRHHENLKLLNKDDIDTIGGYFDAVARVLATQPEWQEGRKRRAVVAGLNGLIQGNPVLSEAAFILVGRLLSSEILPTNFEKIVKLIGKMDPITAAETLKFGFRSAISKPEIPSLLPRFAADAIEQLGVCLKSSQRGELGFEDLLVFNELFSEILQSLDLPEWNLPRLEHMRRALNVFLVDHQDLELNQGVAGSLSLKLDDLINNARRELHSFTIPGDRSPAPDSGNELG